MFTCSRSRRSRRRDPSVHTVAIRAFTPARDPQPTTKQQAYLDFIRDYSALHRESPAEADMVEFFRVAPPSVHRMVVALAEKGLITREPGQRRSIRLVEGVDHHSAVDDDRQPASRPPDDITAPIDPEIASLVEALRAETGMLTKNSCSGHGKEPAWVELAVEGIEGLRRFVERVNLVDRRLRNCAVFEIMVNWSEEVVTSCAFDVFPNWIMLVWHIEGGGRAGAPSAALLRKVADVWRAVSARP